MTDREKKYIAAGRRKARTDTVWLARNIFGLSKIVPHVHGPMVDFLQGFQDCQGKDIWDENKGHFVYTPKDADPAVAIQVPDDAKKRLLLAPRGWYKTSINVLVHTAQLILNFPDITVLWLHASQEVLEPVLYTLKRAFWKNPVMRYYFPEFCIPENSKEFGTQTVLNIPNRQKWTASPTVGIGGIESVRTGMHYHWIKFTDIVDEKNTATKDQIIKIIERFTMSRNLLISPRYWMDIEGTRYNFGDLYGRVIDEWLKEEQEGLPHEWKIFVMGCYKKDLGAGRQEKFTPNELDPRIPYLLDNSKTRDERTGRDYRRVSRFPEEAPAEILEKWRTDKVAGEDAFNTQQLNNPVGTDNVAFPLDLLQWKSSDDIKRIQMMYFMTIVDLAETRNKRSDFTAITTVGVDRTNRRYVVDIRLGKFMPDEIVDLLFMTQLKWKPVKIKVEETGFVRGLLPAVRRKSEFTGIWPNFDFIPPDNQISKEARILSLQPMYKAGLIYFSSGLDEFVKEELRHELTRFPKYQHDDILDTLADMYQDEPVYGIIKESKSEKEILLLARQRMLENLDRYDEIYGSQDIPESYRGLGAL